MTTFTYTARDNSGKKITGEVTANSSAEASRQLRSDGNVILSLNARRGGALSVASPTPVADMGGMFAPTVKIEEVRSFLQSLSVMIMTGVSLTEALATCLDAKSSPQFTKVLSDVIAQVEAGGQFSAALARHPRVFSPLVVNMVKASEASGQLGPMLRRVSGFLANQQELGRKIKGAVSYPIVMITLAIGVLIFMVSFVLPKFAKIYAGREDALPAITKLLLVASGWVSSYGLYAGAVFLPAVIVAIVKLRNPAWRPMMDRMKLGIPLMGRLFHATYLARMLRTMGTLLQSGVSLLDAVDLTRDAVGCTPYATLLANASEKLQGGHQLSEAFADNPLVPRAINKMLQSGERGGTLGDVMDQIATHCEEEVASNIKTVTSLIEPAIVIFVGSLVGTIVLALLLPIFTISKALQPH